MGLEIFIDGEAVPAREGANLLEICLEAKRDLPYFCWHPALGSVGACRQCAVKLFTGPQDASGKIVMACMTRVEPNMRVSIAEPEAAAARDAVVEFVLAGHPHDCPVCEVAGECHLQDMTALTYHHARRSKYAKRTHKSQDLGPFIRHEMNRCIGCYRCVRFYQDHAGGTDFGVFGTAKNIFFGRAKDGALESQFAGNLVEVCPTGVFVDKPFSQNFRRKWDMRATPSICPHCAVGCNLSIHERDGVFRRAVNRFNPTLNGYFLCDRGRFGVGFLESPARLRASRDRYAKTLSRAAVVSHLARVLREQNVVGIGSPRASLESNFVLRRLLGSASFYAGWTSHDAEVAGAALQAMAGVPVARVADARSADAVLALGQDPFVVAPILGLALRQSALRPDAALLAARGIPAWDAAAARNAASLEPRKPIFVVGPAPTGLDDLARQVLRLDAELTAAFGFAVARGEDEHGVGDALARAARPVVVAGGSAAIIKAGAAIVASLVARGVQARLSVLLPAANAVGLGCFAAPPVAACEPAAHAIVLENDALGGAAIAPALGAATITCLDHIQTATVGLADVAVAVASFADGDGTFVNLEGRVQRSTKAIYGAAAVPASWEILRDAGIAAGILAENTWPTQAALLREMAAAFPALAPCAAALPATQLGKPPGLHHRYSGRTAVRASNIREQKPPAHAASPYAATMEGAVQTGAEPLVWAPGWNSGQAILRLPHDAAADVFLFTEKQPTQFVRPEQPSTYENGSEAEEMSALSPAIIERSRL
jgi:NADH-quinone oxidoreductase subunit G